MKICLIEPMGVHAKRAAENGQAQIRHLLEQLGHQVFGLSCNTTLYAQLHAHHPDVVFVAPSVYRTEQGRLVPAVAEMAGLRYTGSGVLALSLGARFARLYPLLFAAGIPLLSHEELLLVEQVSGRRFTIFALDQVPLFCHVEDEVRSLIKQTCQLIEARGLVRFDLVWADRPTLISLDVAPDPLDEELLRQASGAGWNEQQLVQALVEYAGRDSDVLQSPEVTIRPLSPIDSELAQLLRIENASFATDAYQIEDFRNVYLKCSELSVVAEIEGQIAGYMMTRRLPDRGDIFSVAVAPAYRRRDIGEALFRYTTKRLNEWGIAKIELEVRKSNEAGTSFWTRMGFVPVSTIPCFYDDAAEAILMRKVIGAS